MSTTRATNPAKRTYRVEVTAEDALTLPEDLSRQLGIRAGDVVEFQVAGEQAVLRRASGDPPSSLRGLLSDYFTDRDDVQRFIDEERRGWTADEESSSP